LSIGILNGGRELTSTSRLSLQSVIRSAVFSGILSAPALDCPRSAVVFASTDARPPRQYKSIDAVSFQSAAGKRGRVGRTGFRRGATTARAVPCTPRSSPTPMLRPDRRWPTRATPPPDASGRATRADRCGSCRRCSSESPCAFGVVLAAGLPVIRDGRLVGVIGRADLLRARSTAELPCG
jgi:hypothetical protein